MVDRARGFTLIELILTTVVVSGGFFGLLTTFDAANRGAIQGQAHQAAVYLAQERLEQMTADKYYRGYGYLVPGNYPASEAVTVGSHQYTRLITITEVSGTDLTTAVQGSGYKRVAVTVSWPGGATNQLTLETVMGQY